LTITELLLFAAAVLAGFIDAIAGGGVTQQPSVEADQSGHFYLTVRLISALLIATLVPFAIDRHARRSGRVAR